MEMKKRKSFKILIVVLSVLLIINVHVFKKLFLSNRGTLLTSKQFEFNFKDLPVLQFYRAIDKTEPSIEGNVGITDYSIDTAKLTTLAFNLKLFELYEKNIETSLAPNITLFEMKNGTENCEPILNGNESDIQKVLEKMKSLKPTDVFEDFDINKTKNCQEYKESRGYILTPASKKEVEFPIAFSIVMYRDVLQAERLLRAIYRPQNVYCIHVDKSSKDDVKEAMASISECFHNIFISSRSVKVIWGQFSLLEPELICMEDLWHHKTKWKYFINLTGHEFPLTTNLELVSILDVLNGTNVLEGTIKRANKERWETAPTAPHGIRPTKGNVHVVVNRDYVDYVLHNKTANDILEWVKLTQIPDETFFSTLNHNPHLGIRGSYTGEPETDTSVYPYLARFINWHSVCRGKRRHGVCVFGVGDLQVLVRRKEFFTNKLFWNYQPFTLFCLEQWHRNKTINDYRGTSQFNLTFYQHLDFLKHRVF